MVSDFFSPENLATYEIMWKSIVEPDRPQMTIWRMRIALWIPMATNTHSEYVALFYFPLNTCMALPLTFYSCLNLSSTKLIRKRCFSHCSRTSVACWTTRCVKGFLSFRPLALTHAPTDVTISKLWEDSIFGNSFWHCVYIIRGLFS
jgi:hypothetical protein